MQLCLWEPENVWEQRDVVSQIQLIICHDESFVETDHLGQLLCPLQMLHAAIRPAEKTACGNLNYSHVSFGQVGTTPQI